MLGKFIFSSYHAAASHFTAVANNLTKMNIQIIIYTIEINNSYKVNLSLLNDQTNSKIFKIKRYKVDALRWIQFLFLILKIAIEIKKHLKKYRKINVYIRADAIGLILSLFLKAIYRNQINLILEHNAWLYDMGKIQNYPELVNVAGKYIQVFAANHANFNRAITKGIADLLIDSGVHKNKIFIAGNGSSPELFKPLPRNETIKRLNLEKGQFYLGFIGYLVKWQGVDMLIKSINLLRNLGGIKLLIVGDGPEKNNLEKLAKKLDLTDRIVFVGRVPNIEAPFWINSFDICCYTPIKERNETIGISPLKIKEYAMCGKPIIATRIKGLEEIEENGFGVLVTPENEEEFSQAVKKLYKNRELLGELGMQGRGYALKNYCWGSTVKVIYEKLI